jgi:hypothetical protein
LAFLAEFSSAASRTPWPLSSSSCAALRLPVARAQIYIADGSLTLQRRRRRFRRRRERQCAARHDPRRSEHRAPRRRWPLRSTRRIFTCCRKTFVEPPFVLKFSLPTAGNSFAGEQDLPRAGGGRIQFLQRVSD